MRFVLLLSYFDTLIGPIAFIQAPESYQDEELNKIPTLMDVYDKEFFFIQISGNIKSANLIFSIPSKYARGNQESLLISIITDVNSEINRTLARELLETFVDEINKIDEAYKAFYVNSAKFEGDPSKFKEISNLFHNFFKSLKPAITALKEAELRYQMLFKSARDAILIIDRKSGVIVDANRQAKKILTKVRKEILGLPVSELYFTEEYEDIKNQIIEMINKEDTQPIETRVKYLDGQSIPVELNASEIKIGDQHFIQTIFRDISDRKKAELSLINSEKKYRRAFNQANFYKELFTHDMNNILHNINSTAELLALIKESPQIKGNKKEIFENLKEQIKKGQDFISTVQKLSQVEERNKWLEKVEICDVMKNAIEFITKNFYERIVDVKVENRIKEFHVMANELLLVAFENILVNAAKFNRTPIAHVLIKVSKEIKENLSHVKIEFIDNGVGIPDERKVKVFLRERDIETKIQGRGLGLSLVKRIIDSYNGIIWVEDRVKGDHSKGSNFILLIPEA